VQCHAGETSTVISTSQVIFATHFCADTVRFQSSNVCLQYFLVGQIHVHNSVNVEKTVSIFFTSE
jgi:hypothetical protein